MFSPKIKIFYILTFQILLNNLILWSSVLYLNFNVIYLIEQKRYSFYNDSLLNLVPFYLMTVFILALAPYCLNIHKKLPIGRYKYQKINHFILFFVIFMLVISYFNIFITGNIPLFSQGYISRFDYLQTTKLWFILKVFGKVLYFIPICTGYLYLSFLLTNKKSTLLYIILFAYLLYVILIGNKFGAIFNSILLFYTPYIIDITLKGKKIFNKYTISFVLLLFSGLIILIIYHYSNMNIENITGMSPIRFIFYRIFAMQGHLSWGVFNYTENLSKSILNMWDSMSMMMLLVSGPDIIDSINRGVSFSGGYHNALLISTNYFLAMIFHIMFITISILLAYKIIINYKNIRYILYSYIFIIYKSFLSQGAFKIFFTPKFLFLLLLLLSIYLLSYSVKLPKKIIT